MGKSAVACHIFANLASGLFLIAGICLITTSMVTNYWAGYDYRAVIIVYHKVGMLEDCKTEDPNLGIPQPQPLIKKWECELNVSPEMLVKNYKKEKGDQDHEWMRLLATALMAGSVLSALLALLLGFLTIVCGLTMMVFDSCCVKCFGYGSGAFWILISAAPVVIASVALTMFMSSLNEELNIRRHQHFHWGYSWQCAVAGCAAFGVAWLFAVLALTMMCCSTRGERSLVYYDDFDKY